MRPICPFAPFLLLSVALHARATAAPTLLEHGDDDYGAGRQWFALRRLP